MSRIISKCPMCDGPLVISTLRCTCCGLELKNDFELSPFDRLTAEQYTLLISLLRHRGNLKEVQGDLKISFPTVKKRLDELLTALELNDTEEQQKEMNLSKMNIDYSSRQASEIIKRKLKEAGGHATVYTARGLPCEIYAGADGKSFTSDKLPLTPPYEYAVFDVIVELLEKQGGRARKGNGRNFKLGEAGCEENTVVGAVAISRGKKAGNSVFDPVFVMAAILEWAGIAINGRGELILTEEYRG